MKTITPNYYCEFQCIADRCRHSCCIGWEIDIDETTYQSYQHLEGKFATQLRENISLEGTPHFRLGEGERCPFLNRRNLCDIILQLGEDSLCQICTDHPRFRNFYTNCMEIGLGLCCEEAGRLILGQTEPFLVAVPAEELLTPEESAFFNVRNQIFSLIQDRRLSLSQRIMNLLKKFQLSFPQKTYREWAEIFLPLEHLEDVWCERLKKLSQKDTAIPLEKEWEIPLEQLLCYFIYRHFSGALQDGRYEARILFSVLGVLMIAALFQIGEPTMEQLVETARLYSSEIEYSEENTEILLELLA